MKPDKTFIKPVKKRCLLLACLLFMLAGCATATHTLNINPDDIMTINLGRPVTDPAVLEKLAALEPLQGKSVDLVKEPFIIEVPKGFYLPVQMDLETPLFRMHSDCSRLVFDRDVYVYVGPDGLLAGPDKIRWAPLSDLDEVKDLFGLGRGNLSIGMSVAKETGVRLKMGMIIQEKSE